MAKGTLGTVSGTMEIPQLPSDPDWNAGWKTFLATSTDYMKNGKMSKSQDIRQVNQIGKTLVDYETARVAKLGHGLQYIKLTKKVIQGNMPKNKKLVR